MEDNISWRAGRGRKRQQIRVSLFVKQNKGRTERLKKQQAKVFPSVVQRKYGLCPNPASVRAARTLPLKFAICVFKHKYLYIYLCFPTRTFSFNLSKMKQILILCTYSTSCLTALSCFPCQLTYWKNRFILIFFS